MKLRLYSFNVNGIRAISKKGFWDWVISESPDIVCLQETKADDGIMAILKSGHESVQINPRQSELRLLNSAHIDADNPFQQSTTIPLTDQAELSPTYDFIWHSCTAKKGYSGTAILFKKNLFSKVQTSVGVGNPKFDIEGRLTCLETPYFTLLNGYFPQGGREGRVAYKIEFYHEVLQVARNLIDAGKKVLLCGDLNTTVGDIDLARPNQNRKTTGCLPEERAALNLFFEAGFIDSFRYFYPDIPHRYSYWDQITRARERNVGWRIDYFLVDQSLAPNLVAADILDQVMGSDHCPVQIELEF